MATTMITKSKPPKGVPGTRVNTAAGMVPALGDVALGDTPALRDYQASVKQRLAMGLTEPGWTLRLYTPQGQLAALLRLTNQGAMVEYTDQGLADRAGPVLAQLGASGH